MGPKTGVGPYHYQESNPPLLGGPGRQHTTRLNTVQGKVDHSAPTVNKAGKVRVT